MKIITGIQAHVLGSSVEEITKYMKSEDAYIVARVGDVEHLRFPAYRLPLMGSTEWMDLTIGSLPVLGTRFDCPAFVTLKFRVAQKAD